MVEEKGKGRACDGEGASKLVECDKRAIADDKGNLWTSTY